MARRPGSRRNRSDSAASPIPQLPRGQVINPYPPVEIISDDAVKQIHRNAMRVCAELGLKFLSDEALSICRGNGADVDGETGMIRMDEATLMHWVTKAPAQFRLHARNPENDAVIGGNHINFSPVAGPPNVSDLDRGRRPGTHADQQRLIKLGQCLNVLNLGGAAPVEAIDLPADSRHLDFYLSQILLTDRPWNARAIGRERVRDALEMAAIARGVDRKELMEQPSLLSVVNVNSPRLVDGEMLSGLMEMAENGQPCIITPFTLAGAMSPVTLAGAISQQVAEALMVIAFTQMVRPGTPVVFGGFTSNVDMKSGSPAFGTPEYAQAVTIGGQMARFYKLPYRSSNVNASNCVDGQATYESMMSLQAAVMSHCNIINHAAGWLEGGITASFEKYILDAELIQGLVRYLQPLEINEECLAFDAIASVDPGGHYFASDHTMDRYQQAFYQPILSDWRNFESWQESGARDAAQRANAIGKQLLEDYQAPPLDAAIRSDLEAYVTRRKREIHQNS